MSKYQKVKEAFEFLRDEENARHMEAYMRDRFKFYGLHTPERRAVYKDVIARDKNGGAIDREFLEQCWADEHREFQYLVTDYLRAMQKFLTYEDVPFVEKFIRSKQWWDTIDGLDRTVGGIAFRDSRINDLMLRWSTDEDFWVRRLAIDHQLLRKHAADTELLEKIIVNNFGSDEFFINKAIGWSLRDYSKTNPAWVRDFIDKYRDRMAPLSLREASKYL